MTLECLASNPFKTTRSIRITSTSAAFMCACFFMFYVCQVPAFFMCVKYPLSLCVSSTRLLYVCQVSALLMCVKYQQLYLYVCHVSHVSAIAFFVLSLFFLHFLCQVSIPVFVFAASIVGLPSIPLLQSDSSDSSRV